MLTGSEDCLPGPELSKSSDFTSGRYLQGRQGIRQRGRWPLLPSSEDRGGTEAHLGGSRSFHSIPPACWTRWPGSLEGNTEGPGTASSEPLLPS